jgi:5-enolpyruvylshikimate-3-phosphate synthase
MSMAILASNLNHKFNKVYFVIDNKNVVKKTFPKFWEYLKEVGIQACSEFNDREINAVK